MLTNAMRVKLFIITYRDSHTLNYWALKSLWFSTFPRENVDIFVIDNASEAFIHSDMQGFATIIQNRVRSIYSTGHLARNWNQSIILGFENLNMPACDVVIGVQHDTKFLPNWYSVLEKIVAKYDYIAQGAGDQLQVFTTNCIKNIGLYDERFCNIGFQEADYFLRAYKFLPNHSSISDFQHMRLHNPTEDMLIEKTEPECVRKSKPWHIMSKQFHPISKTFFEHKWGVSPLEWEVYSTSSKQQCNNYILYPYFEQYLTKKCLEEQLYIHSF